MRLNIPGAPPPATAHQCAGSAAVSGSWKDVRIVEVRKAPPQARGVGGRPAFRAARPELAASAAIVTAAIVVAVTITRCDRVFMSAPFRRRGRGKADWCGLLGANNRLERRSRRLYGRRQ